MTTNENVKKTKTSAGTNEPHSAISVGMKRKRSQSADMFDNPKSYKSSHGMSTNKFSSSSLSTGL